MPKFLDAPSGEHVLDLACGTGIVSGLVAQQVGDTGKIVGLDVNVAMLDMARQSSRELTVSIDGKRVAHWKYHFLMLRLM